MRWLPRSLSVRLFLIMLGGVLLAVLLTAGLARRDHSKTLRQFRLHAAITHLSEVITLLAPLPPEWRARAAAGLSPPEWSIGFGDTPRSMQSRSAPELAWMLSKRLGSAVHVESAWIEEPAPPCSAQPHRCPPITKTAVVRLRFADGQVAQMGYRKVRERPPPLEQKGFLESITVFTGILAAASWCAVRLALRPLRRMARAAEDFGRDIAYPPMEETGPNEVRQAARAFNAMQQRIRVSLAERMQILAAVTHDLKTPLTRLQLRLEQCSDPVLRNKLGDDLAAMRSLMDEGLELAQSLDTMEEPRAVDLGALLQSLCDDAMEAGQDVHYDSYTSDQLVLVLGRPNALRRIFVNLIDNAVKYGHYARVLLDSRQTAVQVHVRDGGPGIPQDRLQDVVKPFVRLESSRSRDTGGTGLGLAIAANLIASQQGTLSFRNLPEGGLQASVVMTRLQPDPLAV